MVLFLLFFFSKNRLDSGFSILSHLRIWLGYIILLVVCVVNCSPCNQSSTYIRDKIGLYLIDHKNLSCQTINQTTCITCAFGMLRSVFTVRIKIVSFNI